ncbi:HPr family phosphocarrier protein [Pseudodesulfovibrio pelocollis]|uniref:HPr family phosphocarrier protein n=1 Tax=Pseudodesulfovibrio pelocollis TaxID=3051432 RepID=UPI00255ACB12|nr:HPr family phosphocarrier protein [Pseudodesulfovibrio sp. SB368]
MTESNQSTGEEQGEYLSRQVVVANEHGLHARPAGKLAQRAQGFAAQISIVLDEQEVDAKSILDVLTLAAGPGDVLEIRASGDDAAQAVEALETLFRKRFND